jgi:hemolysin III
VTSPHDHAATKPLLRGWSHAVSFPIWMLVGVALLIAAHVGLAGRLLLGVYVVGTGTMFLVSAMYHRGRWTPATKLRMQKLDRTAIFLAIAGGYTPIAAAALDGWPLVVVLTTAWVGAGVGMALQWIPTVHRVLRGASYMVVSWMAVFTFPQLYRSLGAAGFWLILAGGICYTLGAIALAARWPDPWPKVFGFHEVFHAFTVVAATLIFVAVASSVAPRLA